MPGGAAGVEPGFKVQGLGQNTGFSSFLIPG